MNRRSLYKAHGFSLVEIMVVVVIIGLLAGIVGVGVVRYVDQSRVTKAKSEINAFKTAVELFELGEKRIPKTSEGLDLFTKVKDKSGKPYMKKIPLDPWGNEYVYKKKKRKDYIIICYGADGREGGEGYDKDITSDNLDED